MKSEFKGGAIKYFFFALLTDFIVTISLGLAYPAIMGVFLRWRARKTYINGLELTFDGKAKSFYGKFLVMYTVSILTCGIYFIVGMYFELRKWEVCNLHVKGRKQHETELDVKWYQLIFYRCVVDLVSSVTLGLAYPYALCEFNYWLYRHIRINEVQLSFSGEAKIFFFKMLGWELLSIITLGIYYIWYTRNVLNLEISHVDFADKRYIEQDVVYIKIPAEPMLPQPPQTVLPPVMGQTFAEVNKYLKLKRAMMCFVCEVPFFIGLTVLLAFVAPVVASYIIPTLVFSAALLSLPAIFYVDEHHKDISDIHFNIYTTISVLGIIFSLGAPIYLPIFISGLIRTLKIKKMLYVKYDQKEPVLTEEGKAFMKEETEYYSAASAYQIYLWDSAIYRRKLKNFANKNLRRNQIILKTTQNKIV